MYSRFLAICAALAISGGANAATLTDDLSMSFSLGATDTTDLTGTLTTSTSSSSFSQPAASASASANVTPDTAGVATNIITDVTGATAISLDSGVTPGGVAAGSVSFLFQYDFVYTGGASLEVSPVLEVDLATGLDVPDEFTEYDFSARLLFEVVGGVDQNGNPADFSILTGDTVLDQVGPAFFDSVLNISFDPSNPFSSFFLNDDFDTISFKIEYLADYELRQVGIVPLPFTAPLLIAAIGGLVLLRRRAF